MKGLLGTVLLLLWLAGCIAATPNLSIQNMSNDQLLRHYYQVSNAADMDARRAVDNNPFYAGMMEASAKRKQQQKIDAAMELRSRGIQP